MRHRPRILVIQLVPICSELPAQLREYGANVHVALSGADALELVSSMPFDLVILLVNEQTETAMINARLRTLRPKPLVVCMTTEDARLTLTENDADLIVRADPDESRFPLIAAEAASDQSRLRLEH